ncbi:MAG TPA: hypothetical protein VIL07_00455 [Symbiobacteriaceae bacterium]
MAVHNFRVRRCTLDGPQVVGFFDTYGRALRYATRRARETGSVHRVEGRPPLGKGWQTVREVVPEVASPIEAAIARGKLPRVQDASGRQGRVLSYIRPTREVRVAWDDVANPGRGEVIPVDQLTLV